MSKILKTERGFTLIEMMIVLLIISILLLIAVPAMTKSNDTVKEKTCESTVKAVQSQVAAYKMENGAFPQSLSALQPDYVDSITCPGNKALNYDPDSGKVSKPGS
jgi:competence protein ComGC